MSKVEGRGPIDPPPPSLMPSCNFFTLCLLGLKKMLPNQPMILLTLKPFRPPLHFHTCIHCNFFCLLLFFSFLGGRGYCIHIVWHKCLTREETIIKEFYETSSWFSISSLVVHVPEDFSKILKNFQKIYEWGLAMEQIFDWWDWLVQAYEWPNWGLGRSSPRKV